MGKQIKNIGHWLMRTSP